ncbi:MAG TPA: DEAD/DEAH box helicase [Actinomycetota bacterium]|nr:DEAD/DEAH box helicase [Actinomycetota bacterium]
MSDPTFADLGVSAEVVRALEARGIERPFPIQALVMADALAGRDVLAKSRTGSGKTLAFALPLVERIQADAKSKPTALVLVPTRELAVQVAVEFRHVADAKHLKVALAYGGTRVVEQGKRAAHADIVIATPGRIEDLAQRRLVALDGVRILILDEADRMLDMGFQPQVDRIVKRLTGDRQTMFFSATLDGQVGRLARSYTRNARLHEIESPRETVDEASHMFIPVSVEQKVSKLVELLEHDGGKTLVFCRTKRGADRLAWKLRKEGIKASAMHGDLSQPVRERALREFESGKTAVLVATDIAARGLDLERISHVVNYDPPEDDKSYVHRVGRTARAGRSGTGVTFVTPDQQGDIGRMAARLKLNEDFEAEGMKVAPPRIVFSGKSGRYSGLRRRTARR